MKTFVISSLMAAGFGSQELILQSEIGNKTSFDQTKVKWDLLERTLPFTLAGHSSHRSHRSHGSHRSHRSSTYYRGAPQTDNNSESGAYESHLEKPNRNIDSTPNNSVLPHSPAVDIPRIKGNSTSFTKIDIKANVPLRIRLLHRFNRWSAR